MALMLVLADDDADGGLLLMTSTSSCSSSSEAAEASMSRFCEDTTTAERRLPAENTYWPAPSLSPEVLEVPRGSQVSSSSLELIVALLVYLGTASIKQ